MEVIIKNVKNIHSGNELFRTFLKEWVWMDRLSYKPMIMMIEEEATIKQILEENEFISKITGTAIVNTQNDFFEYVLKVRGPDTPEPPRKSGYYWVLFDDRSSFFIPSYEPAHYNAPMGEWTRIGMNGPSVCKIKDWQEMSAKPNVMYETRGMDDEYINKK